MQNFIHVMNIIIEATCHLEHFLLPKIRCDGQLILELRKLDFILKEISRHLQRVLKTHTLGENLSNLAPKFKQNPTLYLQF